jgi:DNA-binding response OmpR family regulator
MRVLILEDEPKDLKTASDIALAAGFNEIQAFMWLAPAILWLEEGLRGERPLPHAMILDLGLGSESGYELLRFWHSRQTDAKVHIIVWSQVEERNRDVCDIFGVDAYVGKWEGEAALREALKNLPLPEKNT